MSELLTRTAFRERCLERDDGECLVPWCDSEADEVHHIMERRLWDDGGYYVSNGASVCNQHHRYAESNDIPPQAFWRWIDVEDPELPEDVQKDSNKWGEPFETPPWTEYRDNIKYPSTRHLPFSYKWAQDDTQHRIVDYFLEKPLVVTLKMDGGNAMLVRDTENPVRARNGKYADHQSFDMLKRLYWEQNLYDKIPEHLQIFGEWLYAKHSIHYGCNCTEPCDDVGPALDDYFQVFGVYDKRHNLWLSWDETEWWAEKLDFLTVPVVSMLYAEHTGQFYDLNETAEEVVQQGHEGLVVRSRFPFHYGQMDERLGKYVRQGHVQPGEEHWSHRQIVKNQVKDNE